MKIKNNEEKKHFNIKKIIKGSIIFFVSIIAILLYIRFIGTNGLIVKEYKITNENFIEDFYGLKIVHLSDIHYNGTTNKQELKKIVKKINLIKPDIVFFTGDLISDKTSKNEKKEMFKILKNIKANIGKYAIKGNHDKKIWDEFIKNTEFIDLNNNYDLIYNNNNSSIFIAGLNTNDNVKEEIANINNFLTENKENQNKENIIYKILILHEPDKILDINYNDFNLILAGHSHGGQIKLPLIGSIYTPKGSKIYYDEYYDLISTKLYISSGIGTSKIKLRLFNKPSFNLYRLTNK